MEATICYLVLSIGLTLAASLNFRRSVLTAKDAIRLHQEAEQAYNKAQQHYDEAVRARLAADQAKDEAAKALTELKRYWEFERLN